VSLSATICEQLAAIVSDIYLGDSAFWLNVLRLAKATICEQLAAICEL
jgi:hypothetical protein